MRQSERWAESEIHAAPMLGILIASDVRFVRESLGEVLGRSGNFSVLGECSDQDEILSMSRELRPDMVLLDAAVRDGVAVVRRLREMRAALRVVVFAITEFVEFSAALGRCRCRRVYTQHRRRRGSMRNDRRHWHRQAAMLGLSCGRIAAAHRDVRRTAAEIRVSSASTHTTGTRNRPPDQRRVEQQGDRTTPQHRTGDNKVTCAQRLGQAECPAPRSGRHLDAIALTTWLTAAPSSLHLRMGIADPTLISVCANRNTGSGQISGERAHTHSDRITAARRPRESRVATASDR